MPERKSVARRPLGVVPADPIGGMLECHDRIRRFLDGLARIAGLEDPADPRAAEAARACARYFREGLPLHALDEDVSLLPRLSPLVAAPIQAALATMTADHLLLDAGLPALLEDLDRVAAGGAVPTERLRAAHLWMSTLMLRHIGMEEDLIFPAARAALPPAALVAIAAEMRARRV